jgi:hypothetical protein
MNDNKDNKPEDQLDDFEEEFEFETEPGDEDALAPEEFETEGEEIEPVEKQPRKNMLLPIVIAAAVVGFIGWKVVGMFTDKEPVKPAPAPVPKIEAPTPAPAPAPVEKAAPQSSLPSMMDAPHALPQDVVATEDALTKMQKKLEEQDNAIKQRIVNLERDLATANQNTSAANAGMSKLQSDIAALNAAIQDISNQLKVQAEEREKREAKASVKKQRTQPKLESANPTLNVYAIIPGRAWLRTANGKTITVTEGDNAGEYGKVLKIDAGNGVVVTSSGVTLR